MIGDLGQQDDLEAARKKALSTGAKALLMSKSAGGIHSPATFGRHCAPAPFTSINILLALLSRGPLLASARWKLPRNWVPMPWRMAAPAMGKRSRCALNWPLKRFAPELQIIAPWREWN